MSRLVAGVFVGGASKRMGGRAKGLLTLGDGTTLVERLRDLLRAVGAEVVLVGASDAYRSMGLASVADEPSGVGPLGGLAGLLRWAEDAPTLALACDLPHVTAPLLDRLLCAAPAPIVAPRRDGKWEPLCARYAPGPVRPAIANRLATGQYTLQALLDELQAVELPLSEHEARQLRDWDCPADVVRDS